MAENRGQQFHRIAAAHGERYRIVDLFPYLDREDEYDDLTLDEAATRIEDLVGIEAAQVISDIEEGIDWPWREVDIETGRETTMTQAVS
jgi:hypothetical protein